ncbi:hypothetical protein GALL_420010 [mine drainage metagenome]|uniref:NAD-specific glutamate dehydrogenase n=1 Tax=mine drainage metagenome TaxID=410659 RepID=A0A1J5QFM9_9ZZZZ
MRDLGRQFLCRGLEFAGELRYQRLLPLHQFQRGFAGSGFHAAHTCRYAGFRHDLEQADIAGAADVGAAAQFAAGTNIEHAHFVAILFAEQHHRTGFLRRLDVHHACVAGGVGEDFSVDDLLHPADFPVRHRRIVHEVEAGLVGIHQRTLLLHMLAQHFAQGLVHQVGGGVVAHGRGARLGVDAGADTIAHRQPAGGQRAVMAEYRGLDFLRVFHRKNAVGSAQFPAVADLAAGFGIERRFIQHHDAEVALVQFLDCHAILVQRQHAGASFQLFVAVEGGRWAVVFQVGRHPELAGGARLFFLVRHCLVESGHVNSDAMLAADVGGQVEREAIGVVQLEGGFAIEGGDAGSGHGRQFLIQYGHAMLDGLEEAVFLLEQHVHDACPPGLDLRVGIPHLGHKVRHHAVEESRADAELVAMADGTADDAAQHEAPAFVAGNHAVGNQEGAGADVIGQDFQRRTGQVAGFRFARGGGNQRLEQVDFVIGMHALQHGGDALQPHAGVDGRLGQGVHHAGLVAVELHEHVVPDFDEAVAVFLGRAGRAAGDVRAVVVENLGAGSAGAGIAHHPEVVGSVARALVVADADHALGRHAHLPGPDLVGLVVLGVDRDQEPVLGQLEHDREQFPGIGDGFALEVVAEAEIAQHLEEGMMACGIADVFQVVVLAAGAYAFLAGGGAGVGPLVEAEEHVLELVHSRVGEQQGGVAGWHQGAGGHHGVSLGCEVVEESLSYLVAVHELLLFHFFRFAA